MTQRVLTTNSTIVCGHPAPPAQVGAPLVLTPAAQDVLTIEGNPVLLDSLANAAFGGGCGQVNTNNGEIPCTLVVSQDGQPSTVLKVNGKPVLLHTTSGKSNGAPKKNWSSTDAKQDVLKAD